ncbi:hypothetical protein CONLIGDRAFT_672676 [Coniochaeta ligniaria NRRL 30616]|uniref:AGC-kinase C-terminal domain-containing protein n=1 Tax=Coniochaeta ligniaria NRRL 30616 TaxID=1408157 RepID=A0A1J7J7C9_9PEZI|nr:hypothetical protein CONLIGDRAFT_672676 [Coniochaeta ligniaria NRRL 30616]
MFPLPHLRSGFRRRGQSNPTSPIPGQTPTLWEPSAFHEHPHPVQDVSPRPESSNSSHVPPTLPPITRVTSADAQQPNFGPREDETPTDHRPPPVRSQRHDDDVGFMGGATLQNHRRGFQEPQWWDNTAAYAAPDRQPQPQRSRVLPPPINTGIPYQRPPPLPTLQTKAGSSFVTPTDLQQLSAEPKGKRPAGTRLATEPALAHQLQTLEVSKGRRGLSSLKDKFLMKRKAAPVTPELGPVSPRFQHQEAFEGYDPRIKGTIIHDFNSPKQYDPRIKGTIIHDFNSPKPRKPVAQYQIPPGQSATTLGPSNDEMHMSQLLSGGRDTINLGQRNGNHVPGDVSLPESLRREAASAGAAAGPTTEETVKPQRKTRPLSLDKALPREPQPAQSDEHHDPSTQTSSPSPAVSQGSSSLPASTPSSRTVRSSKVSVSGRSRRDSAKSAVPRHMKSTSSRFSFDMVGAASQEKLLEEKHRQRQIEKGVDDGGFPMKDRDSRFDDFDNDDYDYDAMMDDDGLEERIPGVNADAEDEDYPEEEIPGINADAGEDDYPEEQFEDELDPDNDQENFSGFVFQRSNPASALASPVPPDLLPTPRDPAGKVIGFAVTKDTTPDLAPAPSPLFQSNLAANETLSDSSQGLGIQGWNGDHQRPYDQAAYYEDNTVLSGDVLPPVPATNDDLYYDDDFIDDGLRDELNFEPEGPAFDESLFDLNDTDKYGRPIPGAFAQAKSMAQQQASNRQSDETSRMSGQSPVSQSTAHTSLDVGLQPIPPYTDCNENGLEFSQPSERRSSVVPAPSSELAYQAALAEAAHKAAASGKFRRGSSPSPLAHLTITSPTDSTESHPHSHPDNELDLDEDFESRGLDDDYDFDDDVIAEANAEALANDSDGWYGREFGFYSAPVPIPSHGSHGHGQQQHHGTTTTTTSLDPSSSPKPLSAENLFQYANGGYFGPAGCAGAPVRSASGRMVSREPNLTPITERSEYSNRNSIMSSFGAVGSSLGPPLGSGSGAGSSSVGTTNQMQSPGLAELALMDADDNTNMSMSALLRLRSKTFGSSKASLLSSPEGSPQSEFSPAGGLGPWTSRDGATSPWSNHHARKGSAFSMQSTTSSGSGAGSPTLTLSAPVAGGSYQATFSPVSGGLGQGHAQTYPSTSPVLPGLSFPPVQEEDFNFIQMASGPGPGQGQEIGHEMSDQVVVAGEFAGAGPGVVHASPTTVEDGQPGLGRDSGKRHRHKGSADSISYIKEEESGGETRWVMERRRTGEGGEVEILGREVVEGGRI